jgi:hypothetical protein
LSRGTLAVSEENKLLTVLGYREPPKEDEKKVTSLKATFTSDKEMLIGFYYNKDSKEQ